ncbi:MAG: dihydrofolate reductase family protein [Rubrobacter sp.]
MRKVVAWVLISVDGVAESPEQWAFSYSDDEMGQENASGMAASDALLLGRVTYEHLAAYWLHQQGGDQMVDHLNSVRKFVVSTTLEGPLGWNNSTLIGDHVAQEIAELKRQPGKDITILGSGILVESLLRDGLLDELTLMVHPVVVGSGKRFFDGGGDGNQLELVGSRTFGTGVVSLTYRPTDESGSAAPGSKTRPKLHQKDRVR